MCHNGALGINIKHLIVCNLVVWYCLSRVNYLKFMIIKLLEKIEQIFTQWGEQGDNEQCLAAIRQRG
jgi:hypothetical protein